MTHNDRVDTKNIYTDQYQKEVSLIEEAYESITLLKNDNKLLPLDPELPMHISSWEMTKVMFLKLN